MQLLLHGLSIAFIAVFNMSITASVIIVFVFLARLCLKRVPRGFSYALWAVVLFRLLCPISFELPVALVGVTGVLPANETQGSTMQYFSPSAAFEQAIQPEDNSQESTHWTDRFVAEEQNSPVIQDGMDASTPVADQSTAQADDTVLSKPDVAVDAGITQTMRPDKNVMQTVFSIGAVGLENAQVLRAISLFWVMGALALAVVNGYSLFVLKRRLRNAVRYVLAENSEAASTWNYQKGFSNQVPIYQSDVIPTAFVLGVLRPYIYLPTHLSQKEQSYILQHEQTHIARFDPLWQALAFLALCLHWFNPLVWFAHKVSQKDMELSCDERVLRQMGSAIKKEYAQSLLNLSRADKAQLHHVLAFGESSAKSRIKNVLSYRKPAFWVSIVSSVTFVTVAILLLANPIPVEEREAQTASSIDSKPNSSQENANAEEASAEPLFQFITVDDTDCAIIHDGNKQMFLPNQSDFDVVFPPQGDAEMEADPAQKTTVYFLQEDGNRSLAYFELTTYAGTTFCRSTFRALEGEESEIFSNDSTTSIFVKTKTVDGVKTIYYYPSGSELIVTSVVETTEQQAIVQAMVQSYGDDAQSSWKDNLPPLFRVDYGVIDITPAERDALWVDLENMQEMAEQQLLTKQALLLYASEQEAIVIVPKVSLDQGSATQRWYEVSLQYQNGQWMLDSQPEENVQNKYRGTVYDHDTTENDATWVLSEVVRNGKLPYQTYVQYVGDANGDGTDEIFAFVTNQNAEQGSGTTPADLWCYHDRTYEKIGQVSMYGLDANPQQPAKTDPHWMTVGTRKLFTVYEGSGFALWANVYTVQDGEVIAFEGIGQTITQGDETVGENVGDFVIVVGAYDMSYMPNATDDDLLYTGHSYKPYYLYWEEENCIFREYGAVEISREVFCTLEGANDALAKIEATSETAYTLDEIYHFANGKYKINYHSGNEETGACYYMAFALENGILVDETSWDYEENTGFYLPAIYPEVAVYPTVEPTRPTAINVPAAEMETLLLDTWHEASPEEMFRNATPDALCTTSDLDQDGNQETWILLEDYNRVVALVVEAQTDGSFTYLGTVENLWQYDGDASTSLQLYQGDGQTVAYAQCVRGGAVAAAGVQTYDVFVTIEDDVLISDTIYYSSLTGEMEDVDGVAAKYHLDLYSGEEVSKETYLAHTAAYLCGASFTDNATVMEFTSVENYERTGAISMALDVAN